MNPNHPFTQEDVDEINQEYNLDLTLEDLNFDPEKRLRKKKRQLDIDCLTFWIILIGSALLIQLIFG